METSEKRRLRFSEKCLCDSLERSFAAQFQNLSLGGAYIATTTPFPVGYRFRLDFSLPDKSITTSCIVRHLNPGTGMGVQFLDLPREAQGLLVRHFERELARVGETAHAKKRVTSRITARIPVKIRGIDATGEPFEEVSETVNLSQQGACIRLRHKMRVGSVVRLGPMLGGDARAQEFRVAWTGASGSITESEVGLTPSLLPLWRSWYHLETEDQ